MMKLYKYLSVFAFMACSAVSYAQDETVNGDLAVTGSTIRHDDRYEHVIGNLSGYTSNPSVDSKRYEIARITVNSHHWASTGPIEIELTQSYYGPSGYLKFIITAGYQDFDGTVTLVEKRGAGLYANVTLGAKVATGYSTSGYPDYYIPIYVDLGYYTYWDVKLSHGWVITNDDVSSASNRLKFYSSPSPTVLSNYRPSPSGEGKIDENYLYVGKLGVGTHNFSGASLAVDGTIRSKEVVVETGWADYVFQEGYDLPSLAEVESHIESEGRLPDVPSASQVEADGLSVGEAQKIMMQKIEELTLYVIELKKQNDDLQGQVNELREGKIQQ